MGIGLLFTIIGGRIAPLVMSHPAVTPYAKHVLSFTALGMGTVSVVLLIRGLF